MTSSYPASPEMDTSPDRGKKGISRSDSPISCYGSSPERVTRQNQLLQPVQLLSRPSRASSEVNIAEREETNSSEACSKSENAFAQAEQVPQEVTQIKEANSKRMGWVKLIRLQLNALHEKKSKSANIGKPGGETKAPQVESTDTSPTSKEDPEPSSPTYQSPVFGSPSEASQRTSVPSLVVSEVLASSMLDADLKNVTSGGNLKKRPTNVRGRISSFWRQAAAASLRHQKQTAESASQKSHSTSPTSCEAESKEAATQRSLGSIFQLSWPTLQQVVLWQHCFQNLLQDPHGLLVFREFLQGEFSDENLEFWIACQKYKSLTDESEQRSLAQEIYDGFIAFQSQREVNLDCETRLQTEMRLSQAEPDLFDASQKRIEALMEKDPYRRFLRSTLYLKLLKLCQNREESSSTSPNNETTETQLPTTEETNATNVNSSPKAIAWRTKSKPSHSVDFGDLRVLSVKIAKS